jgi:hypothetical protein
MRKEIENCCEVHSRNRGFSDVPALYILFKSDNSRAVRVGRFSFHLYFSIPKRVMRPDFIAIILTSRGKCEMTIGS